MDFYQRVQQICKVNPRYKADAYEFVMQALTFSQKKFTRAGHISGKELLEGIKDLGLELYGPMARTVFAHWGITTTSDFGQIVFIMIEQGLMRKDDRDSLDDFNNVYDFNAAFDAFNPKLT
jgi:uncharacterized repeat protein (TIGR04138 family)